MPQRRLPAIGMVLLLAAAAHGQVRLSNATGAAGQRQPLFRHATIDRAWSAAQSSRLPMLIYVTSENCHFCEKMREETFSKPQIGAGISVSTEPVMFNAVDAPELAKKLGIRAFPTTLIISPDSKLLHRIEGFVTADEFAETVWPVLRQANKTRRLAAGDFTAAKQVTPTATDLSQPTSLVR